MTFTAKHWWVWRCRTLKTSAKAPPPMGVASALTSYKSVQNEGSAAGGRGGPRSYLSGSGVGQRCGAGLLSTCWLCISTAAAAAAVVANVARRARTTCPTLGCATCCRFGFITIGRACGRFGGLFSEQSSICDPGRVDGGDQGAASGAEQRRGRGAAFVGCCCGGGDACHAATSFTAGRPGWMFGWRFSVVPSSSERAPAQQACGMSPSWAGIEARRDRCSSVGIGVAPCKATSGLRAVVPDTMYISPGSTTGAAA
mmetsp:Transcript_46996/g.118402  ORF Transcript_46996/g.118402 Transcript_46996/m.118402 type:complete len:256 (-) Transcript_46996:247-1014(-)